MRIHGSKMVLFRLGTYVISNKFLSDDFSQRRRRLTPKLKGLITLSTHTRIISEEN